MQTPNFDSPLFRSECVSFVRVKEITKEGVVYTYHDKASGKTVEKMIPANFVLWSTGIAMNPFTQRVSDLLPNQVHKKVRRGCSCVGRQSG